MKSKILKTTILTTLIFFGFFNAEAQVLNGVFGTKTVAGKPYSGSQNKWVKLSEMTLDGAYTTAGFTMDLYPQHSNHGDSRQQISVLFRNNSGTGLFQSTWDIALFHMNGQHKTIKDIKVVHTSGSGVTNNKLSVWVQVGISWLSNIPIEVRKHGDVTVHLTNQEYFNEITETGQIYDMRTYFGMSGDLFEVDGSIRARELICEGPETWPDYVFEEGYDLMSLDTVASYINQYGHLPNIPSAAEVKEDGLAIANMNKKLLEKVEELTLYTIDQENKLNSQENKLTTQEQLIGSLIERLKKLENK